MGLSMAGRKFYRDKNISQNARKNFLHDRERARIVCLDCGGYDRMQIKPIWWEVVMDLMHYFMLDARFMALYGHHFVLLNHFFHCKLVSFHFYLLSSLEEGILKFKRNPKNPYLHEGLMLLIVDFLKANCIVRTLVSKKKGKGSGNCRIQEIQDFEALEFEVDSEGWSNGYDTNLDYTPSMGDVNPSSSKASCAKHKLKVLRVVILVRS